MFTIKTATGKTVKDAITGKPRTFETRENAEKFCNSMHRTAIAMDKRTHGWHVVEGA